MNHGAALSIILHSRGAPERTLRSVENVYQHTDTDFELIVSRVDSGSSELRDRLDVWPKARLLNNRQATSFGTAVQKACAEATGRVFVFLHDDTVVQSGWLTPLLTTLNRSENVGAVLPLVVGRDGTIQNAGALVWRDGSTYALARGQSVNERAHLFTRRTDFVSTCCVLVRRSAYEATGGFQHPGTDVRYEALDLCFALEDAGMTVFFQPSSVVVHAGDCSLVEGDKCEPSRRAFELRWSCALSLRPKSPAKPPTPRQILEARDALTQTRILIFDDRVPHHDRGSGDPRMHLLLEELVALWPGARFTFLPTMISDDVRYERHLSELGIEVIASNCDPRSWLESRRYYYNIVILSRPKSIVGLVRETQPQALLVYDMEALFFRRLERMAATLGGSRRAAIETEASDMRQKEIEHVSAADAVWCVSDEEMVFTRAIAPRTPSSLLSYASNTPQTVPNYGIRKDLLFYGGFLSGPDSPNEDAVVHLVLDILPYIWAEEPDLVLYIVGADPTPKVQALQDEKVRVIGFVTEPAVWLRRCRVLIVPMRYGSGIRIRFVESMAAGLPFVTTSVGAEGLPLEDLDSIVVGHTSFELSRLTLELYRSGSLWNFVSSRLQQRVATRFGRDSFRSSLIDAMAQLGVPPPWRAPA